MPAASTAHTTEAANTGHVNLAIVRGRVTSEPRTRELPSGSVVTQLEVSTHVGDVRTSVPVVVVDRPVTVGATDEIVVVGEVRRRFFRAGGVTQSRTEVVANRLVRANRRRSVDRVLCSTVADLEALISPAGG